MILCNGYWYGIEVQHSRIFGIRLRLYSVSYTLILKENIEMREGIHPDYYQAKVVCNCGNEFVTGSTKEDIHVEICSKCHSFYTGQQKAIKARGRIDKFNKKYGVKTED